MRRYVAVNHTLQGWKGNGSGKNISRESTRHDQAVKSYLGEVYGSQRLTSREEKEFWTEMKPLREEIRKVGARVGAADPDDMFVTVIKLRRIMKKLEGMHTVTRRPRTKAARMLRADIAKIEGQMGLSYAKLAALLARADKLANRYVSANLKLVIWVGKTYGYFNKGLPFLEVLQLGNVGLLKAFWKFAPERGNKFATYANWWIRQAMQRGLQEATTWAVRIPIHTVEVLRKLHSVEWHLRGKLGRIPLSNEIAREMELPLSDVEWMRTIDQVPFSLQEPRFEDGGTLEDTLQDSVPSLFDSAMKAEMSIFMDQVIDQLPDRRGGNILKQRFGIGGGEPRTLEEIGKELHLSRERVRQIEKKILEFLRRIIRSKRGPLGKVLAELCDLSL